MTPIQVLSITSWQMCSEIFMPTTTCYIYIYIYCIYCVQMKLIINLEIYSRIAIVHVYLSYTYNSYICHIYN